MAYEIFLIIYYRPVATFNLRKLTITIIHGSH